MAFDWRQKVLFKHCDPAGIVFYPRYFEMINDCVEAFFDHLNYPFESFHPDKGVPTVRIETTFLSPGRHGEWLDFTLDPRRIGRSSVDLSISARTGGEDRFRAALTLVHVNNHAAAPWPDNVRRTLSQMIGETP